MHLVRSRFPAAVLAVLIAAGAVGCSPPASPDEAGTPVKSSNEGDRFRFESRDGSVGKSHRPPPASCPEFREVQHETGVQFRYENGANGRKLMVEATGGGAAWIDFDRDGRPDLYFVQGGDPAPAPGARQPPNRLYHNVAGERFEDATLPARVGDTGYGQGIAVGDFDDDGFDDIYVTNVGSNVLYRNRGDGTFDDVTLSAGVDDRRWSTSAAWGDLNGDGRLDLFVCNYVDYDPRHPLNCGKDGTPRICHPHQVEPVSNECFLNLGNGHFRAVAAEWGMMGQGSKSLGVVIADFDRDGRQDVYVANDTTANFLFRNLGNNRFEDVAVQLGCALRADGEFQASMGVAFGDYDENGFQDLYVTHFTSDSNTLYANHGATGFQDVTRFAGLHGPTLKYLGFGTVMCDFDADGRQELFITNGHIDEWRDRGTLWEMPPQLLSFAGTRWLECSQRAGPVFRRNLIGRGVATADYDGDGAIDLVVVHQNDEAVLLRNVSKRGNWLNVRLIGRASNRRGVGAEVTLRQGGKGRVRQLAGGTSYCAAHEPLLPFGLGTDASPCTLSIRWPSGARQTVPGVSVNREIVVVEPVSKSN
jgi:hypothetical protein